MNSKLNIQELSEQIAKGLDMSVEDVSVFLDAMFLLIYDTLLSGEEVRIKGIGVFKLALVDRRESVDVNTGERIEIPQHYKVAFTPDNQLKEVVNKPFSIFDTIDLSESAEDVVLETYELELLDRAETANLASSPMEVESIKSVVVQDLDLQQYKSSGQEELGDDLSIVKAVGKREVAAAETDFAPSELFVAKPENMEILETQNVESCQDVSEEEIVVDKEETKSSTDKVLDERAIEEVNEMPRLIQDAILAAKAEWSKEQLADKELLPSDIAKPIVEIEHTCNYPRSGSFSISLLILLAGFAMGGMCVYCYFLSKNIEDRTLLLHQSIQPLPQVSKLVLDTVATEPLFSMSDTAITDVKYDSTHILSVETSQSKNVDPGSFEKSSSDDKDLSIQIKLKNGMRLALLAEKYYGNKVFWVYIYEANKDVIKNPNILPVGAMINIPSKSLYSINADDSTSLEKAKKLQSQLLGKFE